GRGEEAVLGPRPTQPGASFGPLQKFTALRSAPRYSQRTKWCVPGVARSCSSAMSIGLRFGVTWYSHASRSPPTGIGNGVMRIWKPCARLWRCSRLAPAGTVKIRQRTTITPSVRMISRLRGLAAGCQHATRRVPPVSPVFDREDLDLRSSEVWPGPALGVSPVADVHG